MRLPSFVPAKPAPKPPTLAQLRERLSRMLSDGTGMRLVNETETIADRLHQHIVELEIKSGLRADSVGPKAWGAL